MGMGRRKTLAQSRLRAHIGASMTAQLARLDDRALIRIGGPDWRSFLQGLLTQDVVTLEAGDCRFAAMLSPQGKLLFDLFLHGTPDGAVLDVQAGQRDALVQRLTIYRLRAKVEIAPLPGAAFALWGAQSAGVGWTADPRLPELGFRAVGETPPAAPGAEQSDADAYEAHRLALGAPDPARDCTPDKTYPIEADFDLLNGVDFQKGCFVGQETTSRMKRRGPVKSRMVPIAFEGEAPAFGAEVLAGTLRAGEVLSGRAGRAMALLRLDRAAQGGLTVDGRPVTLAPPPWITLPSAGE